MPVLRRKSSGGPAKPSGTEVKPSGAETKPSGGEAKTSGTEAKTSGTEPPVESNPAAKEVPASRLAKALADAWRRRDRLQDRNSCRGGWTPADYAPHLWREYQELLLKLDRRSRAGTAFDPAKLTAEIARDLDLDESLFLLNAKPGPAAFPDTIADRLTVARKKFLHRLESERFFTQTDPLHKATQAKNDLLMRVAYYVRCNATASRSSAEHGPFGQDLRGLLSSLRGLIDLLEPLQSAGGPQSGKELPAEVAEQLAAAEEFGQRIDSNFESAEPRLDRTAIAALLNTPLPSAAARMRLLAALAKTAAKLPDEQSPPSSLQSSPRSSSPDWAAGIHQQAELEVQLAGLANLQFRSASLQKSLPRRGRTVLVGHLSPFRAGVGRLLSQPAGGRQ